MLQISTVHQAPTGPAIYAMYGGNSSSRYVAYVGLGVNLRTRLVQHLVRRDSSVTTGASAVMLQPERIVAVRWWSDPSFSDAAVLEAAELVAFEILDPVLRSRGNITERAKALQSDVSFVERMEALFEGEAAGLLEIPTLADALERINALEGRIAALEALVREQAALHRS